MGQWLQDWAQVLSAIGTILMMFTWVFYAQFAIMAYLRQRRARVVIDQTADQSLNTKFVIVNLSQQPVYISCVMVAVRADGEDSFKRISTYTHFMSTDGEPSPKELETELRHGTLGPGDLLMIGGSERILSWLLDHEEVEDSEIPEGGRLRRALSKIDHFELRVIAMVGNEDKPIASRRRFLIQEDGEDVTIYPEFNQTQQFNSWFDRKVVEGWSEFCLRGQ